MSTVLLIRLSCGFVFADVVFVVCLSILIIVSSIDMTFTFMPITTTICPLVSFFLTEKEDIHLLQFVLFTILHHNSECELENRKCVKPSLFVLYHNSCFNFQLLTCQLILIQVLIILTDDRTCALQTSRGQVSHQLIRVKLKHEVKVITVAFGPHADPRELKNICPLVEVSDLHFGVNESPKFVGKGLLHSKCPNNMRTGVHLKLLI